MFTLYADKTQLTVRQREPVTSGSVNVYPVQFEFSEDWDGLIRTAVFKAGAESRCVPLDDSGQCVIPWEVLAKPLARLMAGVCGTQGGETVLPTVWADMGVILPGAAPGADAQPPTPNLWEQELGKKQDRLHGLPGQVVGFDESGSAVPVDRGTGTAYEFGHGLKQSGHVVSVDAVADFSGDNTLPMTAAGVQTVVGNIDVLLGTI